MTKAFQALVCLGSTCRLEPTEEEKENVIEDDNREYDFYLIKENSRINVQEK